MFAHYFKTASQSFVIISTSYAPTGLRVDVIGKVEARKVAKAHNATPWNF